MGKLWLTTNAGAVTTFFEPKKKKKKNPSIDTRNSKQTWQNY
jgi:hypothetical protein